MVIGVHGNDICLYVISGHVRVRALALAKDGH